MSAKLKGQSIEKGLREGEFSAHPGAEPLAQSLLQPAFHATPLHQKDRTLERPPVVGYQRGQPIEQSFRTITRVNEKVVCHEVSAVLCIIFGSLPVS